MMNNKSLKDRAKELANNLPFMEGKEKGEMKRLVGATFTITDYGFLKDEHNDEYVCFIVKEDPQNFYFGGQVLTDNMRELHNDGYYDAIINEGLPVEFGSKRSKNGKEYVTATFFPENSTNNKKK